MKQWTAASFKDMCIYSKSRSSKSRYPNLFLKWGFIGCNSLRNTELQTIRCGYITYVSRIINKIHAGYFLHLIVYRYQFNDLQYFIFRIHVLRNLNIICNVPQTSQIQTYLRRLCVTAHVIRVLHRFCNWLRNFSKKTK